MYARAFQECDTTIWFGWRSFCIHTFLHRTYGIHHAMILSTQMQHAHEKYEHNYAYTHKYHSNVHIQLPTRCDCICWQSRREFAIRNAADIGIECKCERTDRRRIVVKSHNYLTDALSSCSNELNFYKLWIARKTCTWCDCPRFGGVTSKFGTVLILFCCNLNLEIRGRHSIRIVNVFHSFFHLDYCGASPNSANHWPYHLWPTTKFNTPHILP